MGGGVKDLSDTLKFKRSLIRARGFVLLHADVPSITQGDCDAIVVCT